jgi:hypothetical protein
MDCFCADAGSVTAAHVVMMTSVRIFRIDTPSCQGMLLIAR